MKSTDYKNNLLCESKSSRGVMWTHRNISPSVVTTFGRGARATYARKNLTVRHLRHTKKTNIRTKIYYCSHCHIQFSHKSSLADHNKQTHTNEQDDLVRNSIIRVALDSEFSPFLLEEEDDEVYSKYEMSGHSGAFCSDPPIGNVPTKFLKAFPKSQEAYETVVADIALMKSALKGWTSVSQPC